jgi:hypothetical protein
MHEMIQDLHRHLDAFERPLPVKNKSSGYETLGDWYRCVSNRSTKTWAALREIWDALPWRKATGTLSEPQRECLCCHGTFRLCDLSKWGKCPACEEGIAPKPPTSDGGDTQLEDS